MARFAAVHGLVGNACITRPAIIAKATSRPGQEVIDVHLTGAFFGIRAAGRRMVPRSRDGDPTGCPIVNIAAGAGCKGSIGRAASGRQRRVSRLGVSAVHGMRHTARGPDGISLSRGQATQDRCPRDGLALEVLPAAEPLPRARCPARSLAQG
jgi:NAD(P)-dependent dehydrogenase (short-subunit alcohol dehydrogenase family)